MNSMASSEESAARVRGIGCVPSNILVALGVAGLGEAMHQTTDVNRIASYIVALMAISLGARVVNACKPSN